VAGKEGAKRLAELDVCDRRHLKGREKARAARAAARKKFRDPRRTEKKGLIPAVVPSLGKPWSKPQS
jgi:hypothetical protein